MDKKEKSSCCCCKKEVESDSDSNEGEESEEVFDDFEPKDGILDFNRRIKHYIEMVETLPELSKEEQENFEEDATPAKL